MNTPLQRKKLLWLAGFFCLLGIGVGTALSVEDRSNNGSRRALLLGQLMSRQLPEHHYSHRAVDDDLSRDVFELYVKQLDYQKRFLLEGEKERLRAFSADIDDEITRGPIRLPLFAGEMLADGVRRARRLTEDILSEGFDFTLQEGLETDPEKRTFCRTESELKNRWRKILKYQVLATLLDLEEGEDRDGKLLDEAIEEVSRSLERTFSRMLKEEEKNHYNRYLDAVARVYDPHTNYLPPSEKEDFDITMRGSLEGIGALLREEDGYIKVVRVIPGSAASRQGQLEGGDIILKVGEGSGAPVDITDTRIKEAVKLIRGRKGTEVRLTVKKPDGLRLLIPIVRDVVQIEETFVKSATLTDPSSGLSFGYLKIPAFYRDFNTSRLGKDGRNSTDDVRKELEQFAVDEVPGLIVDVRNNGGGALTDAVNIAGLFIRTGPIVQVRSSDGHIQILSDDDPRMSYPGPVIILVNKFSASASEILAAALQDYRRAVVIGGERTYGKGTVQTIIDLNRVPAFSSLAKYRPLGALKVTVQKFYRINGVSTQSKGITPDLILPDPFGHVEAGERYLEHSLSWDRIEPARFSNWQRETFDLDSLRERSLKRTASSRQFKEVASESRRAADRSRMTLKPLSTAEFRMARSSEPSDGGNKSASEDPLFTVAGGGENEAWREELSRDIYLGEAVAVLKDILGEKTGAADRADAPPSSGPAMPDFPDK